jgi:hypothetical protein
MSSKIFGSMVKVDIVSMFTGLILSRNKPVIYGPNDFFLGEIDGF